MKKTKDFYMKETATKVALFGILELDLTPYNFCRQILLEVFGGRKDCQPRQSAHHPIPQDGRLPTADVMIWGGAVA
jgi:hypothetical protein